MRRAYLLINAISFCLLLASIITAVINWSKTEDIEIFPPSCYPYRFHVEFDFDISRLDEHNDYLFALIPTGVDYDTLEVLIDNDPETFSYINFRKYPQGSGLGQRNLVDPTATLHPPWLIQRPSGYPDFLVPITYEEKNPRFWYFKNREVSPLTDMSAETFEKGDKADQEVKGPRPVLDKSHRRIIESGCLTDALVRQDLAVLQASDFDPRIAGFEIIVQTTQLTKNFREITSQIRCYNLDSWQELWRFDVPSGVQLCLELRNEQSKLYGFMFLLRGDYHTNRANGMVDTTSHLFQLDLDGQLLSSPLVLGSEGIAWHIENSYPLPGGEQRFLMVGHDSNRKHSFLEIRDSRTLEILSHQIIEFVGGGDLLPAGNGEPGSFQILTTPSQYRYQLYDSQLQLRRELKLDEPIAPMLWMPELRGTGFKRQGTHLVFGAPHSGRLLLTDSDLRIISAEKIEDERLTTISRSLLYQPSVSPLHIVGPDYDTWYFNFTKTSLRGHYTKRYWWFLSATAFRQPAAGLLFIAAFLIFGLGHFMLLRRRWWFYRSTVSTLFRHSPDAILILDHQNRVRTQNQRFRKLIQTGDEAAVVRGLKSWLGSLKRVPRLSAQMLLTGTQLETLYQEAVVKGKTSGTIELLEENQPATFRYRLEVMQTRGATHGHILTLQDITRQLDETRRTIWKFMAQNTAHRLKSPLQRIKTVAESTLIKRQKGTLESDEVGENFQKVLNTIRDINQMIHDFLMFSDRKIKPRQMDLRGFLMKNIQHYRQKNLTEGVQLRLELAENLPPVMADEYHLLTLLVNLLDNSLKAVQGEGQITVSADRIKDDKPDGQCWIQLQVADDGVGIPPDVLPRIFQHHESFFRNGHGIGLAVVDSIVKAHNGRISADSEPGKGTVFKIDLPLVEQSLQ